MSRTELAERFREASTPWKTFVLEAHAAADPTGLLRDAFGARQVRETDDVYLHEVVEPGAGVEMVIDHLDNRFWSVHTMSPMERVGPLLKEVVETRRDVDWVWLPSDHLRHIWPGAAPGWLETDFRGRRLLPDDAPLQDLHVQLRGRAAQQLLDLIENSSYRAAISFDRVGLVASERDLGVLEEVVNRQARFAARGDAFDFHQLIISGVVKRYRRFVEAVEARTILWHEMEQGGATMQGRPIVLSFSSPIPDMELFLSQLFSCREPFRLWGMPEMTANGIAEVEAVDLHVGERLRIDVAPEWIRVYLFDGGCGNTVARLASNLQHHFDGSLAMVDDELDEALKLAG